MDVYYALIHLAACAVNETAPDTELTAELQSRQDLLKDLLDFSKEQQMTALAAYALLKGGIRNEAFERYRRQSAFMECTLDLDREMVLGEMEKAGIWYAPMKGIVLKKLYPETGMRQMADNDILFDTDHAEELRTIMESLGFITETFNKNHHDVYIKPPISTFEMHKDLIINLDVYKVYYDYFHDIKSRLLKDDESSYGYHFSNEDFYIYMIVHGYKHQSYRGTGLRTLLDLYVYLKNYESTMDWSYIGQELKKLKLAEIEENNRKLAVKVFSGSRAGITPDLSRDEKYLLDDFLGYGAYGSEDHIMKALMDRVGRARYLRVRIFLPMDLVKEYYPFFYKHRLLLPVLPIYRLITRRKEANTEIKMFLGKNR